MPVHARIKHGAAILIKCISRDLDYRHGCKVFIGQRADSARCLIAVNVRHHDIHQHEIVVTLCGAFDRSDNLSARADRREESDKPRAGKTRFVYMGAAALALHSPDAAVAVGNVVIAAVARRAPAVLIYKTDNVKARISLKAREIFRLLHGQHKQLAVQMCCGGYRRAFIAKNVACMLRGPAAEHADILLYLLYLTRIIPPCGEHCHDADREQKKYYICRKLSCKTLHALINAVFLTEPTVSIYIGSICPAYPTHASPVGVARDGAQQRLGAYWLREMVVHPDLLALASLQYRPSLYPLSIISIVPFLNCPFIFSCSLS